MSNLNLFRALFFLGLLFNIVFAQLSPGKLNNVHKHLEGIENCTKCHLSGKKFSSENCLNCHRILKERIKSGKGLHANPDYGSCQKCHIEHQGTDSDLIYWSKGKDNFDHRLTGYELKGAHQKLKCRQCHQPKNIRQKEKLLEQKKNLNRTFLGLNRDCLSCHYDEHRGQFNKKPCSDCHEMRAWKPALKFKHELTNYPLTGSHQKVECQKCHKIQKDKPLAADADYQLFKGLAHQHCTDCHRDAHQGKLGADCRKCHNTTGWNKYSRSAFNHDSTSYPLQGKHRRVKCESCHKTKGSRKIKNFSRCGDCHTDYHQGQFKNTVWKGRCEECHTVNGFSPARFTIDEHAKTEYPLRGAHKAVPCVFCHKKINVGTPLETMQFHFQSTRCSTCHNDPHKGQADTFKKRRSTLTGKDGCEHCHVVTAWDSVIFDHSLTKFVIEGRHGNVPCIKCHNPDQNNVIQFQRIPTKCQDCHQDIHRGQFAEKDGSVRCEKCHTPVDWLAEKFDHDKNSRFKLTGAHRNVPCEKCHPEQNAAEVKFVRYKPLDTACKTCHATEKKKKL